MLRYVIYVWVIILGVLIIVPGRPPQCLVCGSPFDVIATIISVVLGAIGLYTEFRSGAVTR